MTSYTFYKSNPEKGAPDVMVVLDMKETPDLRTQENPIQAQTERDNAMKTQYAVDGWRFICQQHLGYNPVRIVLNMR